MNHFTLDLKNIDRNKEYLDTKIRYEYFSKDIINVYLINKNGETLWYKERDFVYPDSKKYSYNTYKDYITKMYEEEYLNPNSPNYGDISIITDV